MLICSVKSGVAEEKSVLSWKGCSISRNAFMNECAETYEKITGTKIDVQGGGSTLGIRSVCAGNADICGTCRPCLPDVFPELESGGYMTHVAWDAICFITHPSNPVDRISTQQARDILTGKITNWKEVGGPDKPILMLYRVQTEQGKFSGVGYITRQLLFNDQGISFAHNGLYCRDSGVVEDAVEKLEWTFAADGISSSRKRNIKILNLDDVLCSKENISNGTYPLFRPLYILTKGKPVGEIKKLVDWLTGNEGQTIISRQGTVNLREGESLKGLYKYWLHTELILNY